MGVTYQSTLEAARIRWANARGSLRDGSDDKPLPKLFIGDSVVLLSFVTKATGDYLRQYSLYSDAVYLEDDSPTNSSNFITVDQYLGQAHVAPMRSAEYRVMKLATPFLGQDFVGPYHPACYNQRSADAVVQRWQAVVDFTATTLSRGTPLDPMRDYEVETMFSVVDDFCFILDKSNELPSSNWQLLGSAVSAEASWALQTSKDTVKAAAGVAGDALAQVGDTAGEAAGHFLSNFFSSAGIPALAVTAGALYIGIKVL